MSYAYDASYPVAFPVLPVVVRQIDGDASTMPLSGLIDSGVDITIIPLGFLRAIGAEKIYSAQLRAHWGERRGVAVFLVDLEIENQLLPGIEVVGDERGQDILLGRNVLNKLILQLDGPSQQTDVWNTPQAKSR